jgi:tetratricopeptide (TPR) repeat protein
MSTSAIERERLQSEVPLRGTQIQQVIGTILAQFDHVVKSYVFFNGICLALGFVAFTWLVLSFTFLAQSAVLATSLAFVFLIFFAYFILRLYLQARKQEQLQELLECYISACRNLLNYEEGVPQSHAALASATIKFSNSLQGREYQLHHFPIWLDKFKVWTDQLGYWCHWQDIHFMKELLLNEAIKENIKLVRCAPTSSEMHIALANAYVMLSELYVKGMQAKGDGNDKLSIEFSKKFKMAAESAVEELKTLKEFAPEDPWVHVQLAYSYRDLKMPKEEIQEYEAILRMTPGDRDVMFKLGRLYFQQGLNGQGLRIYDQLKKAQDRRAEELINSYGAYKI